MLPLEGPYRGNQRLRKGGSLGLSKEICGDAVHPVPWRDCGRGLPPY